MFCAKYYFIQQQIFCSIFLIKQTTQFIKNKFNFFFFWEGGGREMFFLLKFKN